ncbi:MAG: zinc ribbon domain-containing protein [Chloroflexota bacterium]|nr:zinc ribbon domain-containing protein [Chloroflexota bacterium]
MNDEICSTCGFAFDDIDNFCRRCGTSVIGRTLPVVRPDATAAVWQPQVSPVVKGAAVMAAGTVGQFLFRRMVSSMLGNGSKRRKTRSIRVRGDDRERDGMVDEAQIITETIMMRRVRVRRQA